jgi:hypothetical protein
LLAFLQDFVNFKKERAKESAKRREPTLTKVSLLFKKVVLKKVLKSSRRVSKSKNSLKS